MLESRRTVSENDWNSAQIIQIYTNSLICCKYLASKRLQLKIAGNLCKYCERFQRTRSQIPRKVRMLVPNCHTSGKKMGFKIHLQKNLPIKCLLFAKKNVTKTVPVDDHPITGFAGRSQPQVEYVKSRYVPRWFHWFLAGNDKIRSALAIRRYPLISHIVSNSNWVSSQWHACAISLALISLTLQLLLSWAVSFRGCLHTQKLLHWTALTHRHFYTLHAELFTQTSFYAETLLHGNACPSEVFLCTDALTHRSFLHRKAFTQSSLYTGGFYTKTL